MINNVNAVEQDRQDFFRVISRAINWQ